MNAAIIALNRHPFSKDVLYWVLFVLTWSLLWGLSDQEFMRNLFIQVSSLPARMLLVYACVGYLYPKYFKSEKYVAFFGLYGLLLLIITMVVQRPLMLYVVQPRFLPFWNDPHFLGIPEIINTALDVNIAAIVPVGYTLLTTYKNRLPKQHLIPAKENYIEVKVDKAAHRIATADILFIESQRNSSKIQLDSQTLTVRETLTSLEEKLGPDHFLRTHRSFLVNTGKITVYSALTINCGKFIIPVGRKYKDEVKTHLFNRKMVLI